MPRHVLRLVASIALFTALSGTLFQSVHAQTFTVIHNFTGGGDGGKPEGGLSMDRAGNFYGTTYSGGAGYGTVFKLSNKNSAWILTPLYTFQGDFDGANPEARVIIGPNGSLYGTTTQGGGSDGCTANGFAGCGTVFNLRPSPSACRAALCPWNETVFYRFSGGNDGGNPRGGDLTFDQAGNIYGTTEYGGSFDWGAVYKLTPSLGTWTESVLHSFDGVSGNDGVLPYSGVIFDAAGNLYGTTFYGGQQLEFGNAGSVYELTPSGSGWGESLLYTFPQGPSTEHPRGGLIFDPSGNLYGTTFGGDDVNGCCGGVFELANSNGGWTYSDLYIFPYLPYFGGGPAASLFIDASGNLFGTTAGSGSGPNYGYGSVFKLTYSNGAWTETDLYDFTDGADGGFPYSNITFDASGNLYGTASTGGASGQGVVWEITP